MLTLNSTSKSIDELAALYGLVSIDLETQQPDPTLVARFPSQLLFRETMVPVSLGSHCCVVAVSDPTKLESLDQLEKFSPRPIEPVLASAEQIRRQLHRLLGVGGSTIQDLVGQDRLTSDESDLIDQDEIGDKAQSSSVIKLVNELIAEALEQRASDIHIEPEKNELVVRYRIDGTLYRQNVQSEIQRFGAAIVSRIKIMARLNIAERRLPQDGRIHLTSASREIDVRVSVVPSYHGESIVLRLLTGTEEGLSLESIGLPESLRGTWRQVISKPHGLILVTGPTGSGKTTTLYGSLAEIRSEHCKIMTVEDPIEYKLRQVSQVQVHPEIGLSFAAGLRSILRHDPDVILVGEIRDSETAKMAIQAAMTGHLVFSTLHTNDAAGAITRLIDMGVEPYLVASTLECVMAQRLVRKLCPHCKQTQSIDELNQADDLQVPAGIRLFQAGSCRFCHGTGYSGRQAIFELMMNSNELRQLTTQKASATTIQSEAVRNGMQTLRQSAWNVVCSGVTSYEELMRVSPTAEG